MLPGIHLPGLVLAARPAPCAVLLLLLSAAVPLPLAAQRPWAASELRFMRDDQPRDLLRATAEYGAYLVPGVSLALLLAGERLHGEQPAAFPSPGGRPAPGGAGITSTTAAAGMAATLAVPAARTGLRASARALFGAPDAGATPLWSAESRTGIGGDVALRARAERDRYGWTTSSIDTLVLVTRMELALDRAASPGWAGELVAGTASFGDDNPVRTAYGWVLAPLSRGAGHALRAGYAAAWQDTERTTWQPLAPGGPGAPPRVPGAEVPGRYAPYHSPHDLRTHSVLGNASLSVGSGWLRLDGTVGVHARESAPVLIVGGLPALQPEPHFYERSFTPYRLAAAWIAPLTPATWITAEGAREGTAYYTLHTARLAINRGF
jgi:hypothetical protein